MPCLRVLGLRKLVDVPGEIVERYRSNTTQLCSCDNILLAFAREAPGEADLAALSSQGMALAARWPAGIGFMLCVLPSCKPPQPEVRSRMVAALKTIAPPTKAMSCVILGEGFLASAKRSVFAALTLALRPGYPIKVFNDVSVGVQWLASHVDGCDGVELEQTVLTERARELADAS